MIGWELIDAKANVLCYSNKSFQTWVVWLNCSYENSEPQWLIFVGKCSSSHFNNCILVYMKAVMLVESVLYFSFPSSHTNSSSINSGAPEEIKRGMQEKICVQFNQLLNHRDQLFFCKRNSSTEEETVTEVGKSNKVRQICLKNQTIF